jgi:hypothetical protein
MTQLHADRQRAAPIPTRPATPRDDVAAWCKRAWQIHLAAAFVVVLGFGLFATTAGAQFELFRLQLGAWSALPRELVQFGPQAYRLAWIDSLFALAYGVLLAYAVAFVLHRAGNPRAWARLAWFALAALVGGDLAENGLTAAAGHLHTHPDLFGHAASAWAAHCGVLTAIACVIKLAAGFVLTGVLATTWHRARIERISTPSNKESP